MEHTFNISYSEAGTFVASSVRAPYFCFEAATEEEVIDVARQALDFYHEANGLVAPKAPRETTKSSLVRSHFRSRRTIRAMEAA